MDNKESLPVKAWAIEGPNGYLNIDDFYPSEQAIFDNWGKLPNGYRAVQVEVRKIAAGQTNCASETRPEVTRPEAAPAAPDALADKLESYIPDGDGYNSEYARTLQQAVATLRQQRGEEIDYKPLYYDLLYQVGTKHPGETRHETAKRYLQNAERGDGATQAKAALKERT